MVEIHVIIPVYNGARDLEAAVASVRAQPYPDIDIVLVDDGSTDSTPALCDRLASDYKGIRVIHQANGGVSRARNAGLREVLETGGAAPQDYVIFLDADDLWCPGIFTSERMTDIAASRQDIVSFSCYYANDAADRFAVHYSYGEMREVEALGGGTTEWLLEGTFCANLYRCGLLRDHELRFMEDVRHNEDVIFSREALFCAERIQLRPEFLHIYRTNPGSATHRNCYTTANAADIANAWHRAAEWVDGVRVSEAARENWRAFCKSISASRLLEAAACLAEAGCTASEIREWLQGISYAQNILMLNEADMAVWQRPELALYRQDFEAFCRKHRCKGLLHRAAGLLLRLGPVRKLREARRFRIRQV